MARPAIRLVVFYVLAMGVIGSLGAAPRLRVVTAAVGPVLIAPGTNGATQTVEAYNLGDGALSLSVSSSVAWITPGVGAPGACATTTAATSCVPLTFALNTASLAASARGYTGVVNVTAPAAVDAPQTITVTVLIGHDVATAVEVYVAPGSTATAPFPGPPGDYTVATQDGANWLSMSVVVNYFGTTCGVPSAVGYCDSTYTYIINVAPQPTNTAGNTYTGSFASSTEIFPVIMNVTALPIAQPSVTQVYKQLAVGAVDDAFVTLSNSGLGTLAISGVTASGPGITATASGATAVIAFDATGLSPNTYTGSASIASNAANSPTTIPVSLEVVPAGPPVIFPWGVVSDAYSGSGSPGDVMALFGQQLSFAAPVAGPAPPLATQLGGASVFVNGEQAPLYYSSYGQINFQMPMDTPVGAAQVQVVTNGQTSNPAYVGVVARAPSLLLLNGAGGYGAIVDASQGDGYNVLPMPPNITIPGFITQPARPGDILTIYAIGLGPTNPSVATGQPAPDGLTGPLAQLTATPTVVFFSESGLSAAVSATPSFAGLSPRSAGLYQINVAIPANCPTGKINLQVIFPDSWSSNWAYIQVQ